MTSTDKPIPADGQIEDAALDGVAGGHHHNGELIAEGIGALAGTLLGGVAGAIAGPNLQYGRPAPAPGYYPQQAQYYAPQGYAPQAYAPQQYAPQPAYAPQPGYAPQPYAPQQYAPQPGYAPQQVNSGW